MPALLLSLLTPLYLPSSSVSVPYFVLAVPMSECLGKQSCMSSPFLIAILNGTCSFPSVQLKVHIFEIRREKVEILKKGKVFSGQEPPSGESSHNCGVNYQLLTVMLLK